MIVLYIIIWMILGAIVIVLDIYYEKGTYNIKEFVGLTLLGGIYFLLYVVFNIVKFIDSLIKSDFLTKQYSKHDFENVRLKIKKK